MNTRKLWAGAAGIALISLALAGCSTSGNTGGGGGDDTVVTFFANSDNKVSTEQEIAEFEDANPGITVKATYAGVSDSQATLATQFSAGTAPDVIEMYPGSGTSNSAQQLASRGYLADLSDRPWADAISEGDRATLAYDGKLYGAPQTALGIGYIYSPEVMEKSGLTPPETWSEVQPFCEAAAAQGTPAYALGLQTGWPSILIPYALTATLVYGPDPEFTQQQTDGEATFADSAWLQAYEMYQDMGEWGCFQDAATGTTYEDSLAQAATGQALGVVQLPSSLSTMDESAPDTAWELTAVPATDDPAETILPSAIITTFGLNADAAEKEAAVKFIDYLASDEAILIQANTSGGIPAVDIEGYEPTAPAVQTVIDYREEGRIYPFIDNLWPNPKVQQEMISGLQGIFAGTTQPIDVLESMDRAFAEGN